VFAMAHEARGAARPVRTCVGCRKKDAPEALLRLAVLPHPPHLSADPGRRLGGRGVSVHPTRDCVHAAVRRGGLARALNGPVPLGAEAIMQQASDQYRRRAAGLLVSAHGAGCAVLGTDAVREAMARKRVHLLLVATDAANRRDELLRMAERLGSACTVFGTKASLGRVLGRDEVAVVAVTEPALAGEILRAARRADALAVDHAEDE
jgi:uncharacterized protein